MHITIEHDDETYERMRHRYIKRDRPHAIAASRGWARAQELKCEGVAARAALVEASQDARSAHKRALAAIHAAEVAAVKFARMKTASLREKLRVTQRGRR